MSQLAAKLLRLIFGLYFGVVILTTGLQLYAEYTDERDAMFAEISESVELVMPALGSSLWEFDKDVIGDILHALLKNRAITGLRMVGEFEVVEGRVAAENPGDGVQSTSWIGSPFKRPFAIEHVDAHGTQTVVGYLYTYSHPGVLVARLENAFISVLIAELIKTAFLCLILYFVIAKVVAVPLVKLSQRVNDINSELGAEKTVTVTKGSALRRVDEFTSLIRKVVTLRRALNKSRAALRKENVQLLGKLEEANAANIAKSEFLANISHELRTPMHAILSFSEIGDCKIAKTDSIEGRKYFKKISTSGERLMAMLNDLLDLAKLDSDTRELDLREDSINRVVELAVEEMESVASQKDVQLQLKTSANNERCLIDSSRCMQVMRNLLSNAIKFSPTGSKIAIEITRMRDQQYQQNNLYVTVEDSGIGIPDNEIELIFDKFAQSSKTRSRAGGTGLGLAISREIIRQHGGKIWAEANRETGSRFVIQFPLIETVSKAA